MNKDFCRTPEGPAYTRLFNICPSVRPYVGTSPIRSVLSYFANIPQTPNIFTDSGPPIKLLLGGLIRGAPNPPNPPYGGGAKIYFGGSLLMDHSEQHGVKYFCEALGFKYHFVHPWGVP